MTTPFKSDYALGVVVQTASGRKVVQHGGGIDGFNTFLAYYPDNKLTVAVLANINGEAPGQIAAKLAELAHGGAVQLTSERKEIALPVATLSKYVGTYEVAPGVNMMIRLDGDHLTTQLHRSAAVPDLRGVGDEVLSEGRRCAGRVLHRRDRRGNARGDVSERP